MDGKTIGHKLRALRGEMDAKTVADALGISTSALFMYERGERIPRDQIKKRIAQYFDQSVEEIFFRRMSTYCAQVHPKEAKKMKNNIQKEIQERREHAERLKKIALKLFEQLKSENVSFSDAERIISLLSASVKTERDDRII